MKPKRLLTLLSALFLALGLLAVPADAVTFTGGTSQSTFAAKPVAPAITLSNVASSGKIKVSWNAVKNASSYKVYRSTSKSGTYKLMKTTTGTSFTNTSAEAGTTYYYYVIALANDGTKSAKSTIKSRTCDLPRPEMTMSNVASSGKIKVSWAEVEGAVKYEVYRATAKDGEYQLMKTTTNLSCTNTGAVAGQTYYYKVRALAANSAANSAYSSVKSRTCDLPRPVISVVLNTSGKPVISWDAVSGATKYTLYIYGPSGELVKSSSTTKTAITHSSAANAVAYTYRVAAIHSKSSANSAKSESVSACYSLSLDTTTKTITEGKSFTLTATYSGGNSLTWKTSNSSVATVSGGKVTAVKAGEATITVTDGILSAACKVTVEAAPALSVSVSEKTLYIGDTWQIPYSYTGNATLTWKTRNAKIITVDQNGLVTAVAEGTSYILVTDGTTTKTVDITVEAAPPDVEEILIKVEDSVFYDGVTRYVGDYCWLALRTDPIGSDANINVTSSNSSVVSVSKTDGWDDLEHYTQVTLNFKSAGTSTITFKSADGKVTQSYKVTVKADYDFNPGSGTLTPQKFAEYTTRVMCANGFTESPTLGSWRQFTLSASELTFENAKTNAYQLIHEWWATGERYCYISYEGINEDGKYVFHEHWG